MGSSLLSHADGLYLLEVIQQLQSDEVTPDRLTTMFSAILPHDMSVFALAEKEKSPSEPAFKIISIDYPEEWAQRYADMQYHTIDPVIHRALGSSIFQQWDDTRMIIPGKKRFWNEAAEFGLLHGCTYSINSTCSTGLYSFTGEQLYHPRHEAVIQLIVPHLDAHFSRRHTPTFLAERYNVTEREMEILRWLAAGKSSWDISTILSISERTVKYHVTTLCQKLDAVNRTHLVAVALRMGLLNL